MIFQMISTKVKVFIYVNHVTAVETMDREHMILWLSSGRTVTVIRASNLQYFQSLGI